MPVNLKESVNSRNVVAFCAIAFGLAAFTAGAIHFRYSAEELEAILGKDGVWRFHVARWVLAVLGPACIAFYARTYTLDHRRIYSATPGELSLLLRFPAEGRRIAADPTVAARALCSAGLLKRKTASPDDNGRVEFEAPERVYRYLVRHRVALKEKLDGIGGPK